ncbi:MULTISPECIES: NAD(P)/FAD-dependent oxidoreductase [Zunongwangia]|jgi:D-amino-acid dehydrogenase|uniref:NAD(P)/FAD-dependent oxidoreductase n=1 Tax=Zunongwangia TaxID=417127 RepID=UPI001D18C650|nr:FAD-dependent oxidoreductase [Zunongwangia profunda]MCC4229597.1 FAD-dependent oxidoreductase [Zunongwangia profunda]
MKKVAIIGGGITGLCSAYYLVKAGYEVTIVDKGNITKGASFINAGYVTPSHFVPLAEPGMINQGIKWMFNNSSPFYIKPRWDIDFFKWSWYFKKSSTKQKVAKAIPVLKELNEKSKELYEEMLESLDFEFHIERKGLLMVYKSAKNEEHETKLAEKGKDLGLDVSVLDKKALHDLEPQFSEDVIGGVHYECDAHSTPNLFMKNLKQWLENNGVRFVLEEAVTGLEVDGKTIKAMHTSKNSIEADEFIMAAGSWTFPLAKKLGLNIPIQPGKGYSMSITRETNINLPAILTEAKVAVTPMKGFTRFAGTMELSGDNNIILPTRVEAIAKAASNYYSGFTLTPEEKQSATSGLRPVSPDGLPFIGKSSKFKNLNVAAGHAMMGWSLGPITGKLISEIVEGNHTSVLLEPFDLERF